MKYEEPSSNTGSCDFQQHLIADERMMLAKPMHRPVGVPVCRQSHGNHTHLITFQHGLFVYVLFCIDESTLHDKIALLRKIITTFLLKSMLLS